VERQVIRVGRFRGCSTTQFGCWRSKVHGPLQRLAGRDRRLSDERSALGARAIARLEPRQDILGFRLEARPIIRAAHAALQIDVVGIDSERSRLAVLNMEPQSNERTIGQHHRLQRDEHGTARIGESGVRGSVAIHGLNAGSVLGHERGGRGRSARRAAAHQAGEGDPRQPHKGAGSEARGARAG